MLALNAAIETARANKIKGVVEEAVNQGEIVKEKFRNILTGWMKYPP